MPKSFSQKLLKKLCSQHFSAFFENESISVTKAILARFLRGSDGPFGKWTFLKMSKIDFPISNLENSFPLIFIIFLIYIYESQEWHPL
jgi:hypothetical protein